jgi:hypothetical protein
VAKLLFSASGTSPRERELLLIGWTEPIFKGFQQVYHAVIFLLPKRLARHRQVSLECFVCFALADTGYSKGHKSFRIWKNREIAAKDVACTLSKSFSTDSDLLDLAP